MKTQASNLSTPKPGKKQAGQFASEVALLAAKDRQFQTVFGKVDWEKAKKDGLIS